MKLFMVSYAKTQGFLPALQEYLFARFWPDHPEVLVLGYGEAPELERFKYVRMRKVQRTIDEWGGDIARAVRENIGHDTQCEMMLDDMLLTGSALTGMIHDAEDSAEFDRFELGFLGPTHRLVKVENPADMQPYVRERANYIASCQPSVWYVPVLIALLGNATTPWSFETESWIDTTYTAGGFDQQQPLRYIRKGCISRRWPKQMRVGPEMPSDAMDEIRRRGWHGGLKLVR